MGCLAGKRRWTRLVVLAVLLVLLGLQGRRAGLRGTAVATSRPDLWAGRPVWLWIDMPNM